MVPAVRERAAQPGPLAGGQGRGARRILPRYAIHQVAHLNDGWYGNAASWIAGQMPAWAEIDLGRAPRDCGSPTEQRSIGPDCTTGRRRTCGSWWPTEYDADSQRGRWHEVAALLRAGLWSAKRSSSFAAVEARWIRVDIVAERDGELPRLDEIEIYEARPVSAGRGEAFRKARAARAKPAGVAAGRRSFAWARSSIWTTAAERMLANCADGVAFLMFDGNWWNGGCLDPDHGHPVPYRMEDHIRANLELARRIHAKYPRVLIEMHDMICRRQQRAVHADLLQVRPARQLRLQLGLRVDVGRAERHQVGPCADALLRRPGLQRADLPAHQPRPGQRAPAGAVVVRLDLPAPGHRRHAQGPEDREGAAGGHARAIVAHDRFYKRGDFYGVNEEIHLHVLPRGKGVSSSTCSTSRISRGPSPANLICGQAGLDAATRIGSKPWGKVESGRMHVSVEMPPLVGRRGRFRGGPIRAVDLCAAATARGRNHASRMQEIIFMIRTIGVSLCLLLCLEGRTMAAPASGPQGTGLSSLTDVPYGVGDRPEALGNHRARVRVERKADAVWVDLPWRRRDKRRRTRRLSSSMRRPTAASTMRCACGSMPSAAIPCSSPSRSRASTSSTTCPTRAIAGAFRSRFTCRPPTGAARLGRCVPGPGGAGSQGLGGRRGGGAGAGVPGDQRLPSFRPHGGGGNGERGGCHAGRTRGPALIVFPEDRSAPSA